MASENQDMPPILERLTNAMDSGAFAQVRRMLNRGLPAQDVAHLLESSPPKERDLLWSMIEPEFQGDVLQHLVDDIQAIYLKRMNPEEFLTATEGLETDDIADLLQQLPDTVIQEVLVSMDAQDRHRVEAVLSYPEDTAGGLMNTDTITVRPDISLDVVMRYLRRHQSLPDSTDSV